jgi:tetratricopeptide (TPR) repeat protein
VQAGRSQGKLGLRVDGVDGLARDYRGLTVSVIGAPERIPVARLRRALERRGATLSRRIETGTNLTVIAHGAVGRLAMGRLPTVIFQAGSVVITEHQFLREMGLLAPLPEKQRDYGRDSFATASRLTRKERFWLELFDVIEPRDGAYDFHDLILARQIKSLIESGIRLPSVIGAASAFRRAVRRDSLKQIAAEKIANSDLVVHVGSWLAAIEDRQRLPFHEHDLPLAGYLYDEAEAAGRAGDWATAERLYRQCSQIDSNDAIALLNRAEAVREQNRDQEAAALLLAATEIDPQLADAWYALARIARAKGKLPEVRRHLERTLLCEPDHADAAYDLAVLYFDLGHMKRAMPLFEIASEGKPDDERTLAARKALALCRVRIAAQAEMREAS